MLGSTSLVEDVALRGFAPLVRAQEGLDFRSQTGLSKVEQVNVIQHQFSVRRFGYTVTVEPLLKDTPEIRNKDTSV